MLVISIVIFNYSFWLISHQPLSLVLFFFLIQMSDWVISVILILGFIFDCVIESLIILHPDMQIELFLLPLVLASSKICDFIFDPSALSHVLLVLMIDQVANKN